jgi:hypothetical protein
MVVTGLQLGEGLPPERRTCASPCPSPVGQPGALVPAHDHGRSPRPGDRFRHRRGCLVTPCSR